MPRHQDQLAVRRHDRYSCDLPGRLRIAAGHEPQIAFSAGMAEADGSLPLRVIDCGDGGLGLHTPVYLPRGAEATLSLALPSGGGEAVTHTVRVRVQRTSMVDRTPEYYLGTEFIDASEAKSLIGAILAAAASEPVEHSPAARSDGGGAAA
ncbi:MAG: PilZ domain-containing protein [Phycisphaerales bacterium JB041]